MSQSIDFYFDFVSPAAYLAYKRIRQLQQEYDVEVVFKPLLLGGLFKSVENLSPISVPAKLYYSMRYDLPRYAALYKVVLNPNPHFPLNTLPLLRGSLAARELGIFDAYCDTVFDAIWQEKLNMADPQIIAQRLTTAGFDVQTILALSTTPEVKQEVIGNAEEAKQRGAFGVPTMYFNDEMYFGQDRLFFIEKQLADKS